MANLPKYNRPPNPCQDPDAVEARMSKIAEAPPLSPLSPEYRGDVTRNMHPNVLQSLQEAREKSLEQERAQLARDEALNAAIAEGKAL